MYSSTSNSHAETLADNFLELKINVPVSKRKTFDFRSDTVTVPTSEMLVSMMSAAVGDDVKNEDPTVHLLEEKIAQLTGKQAALFVCSGTMSNQLAIRTHVTDNYAREVVHQEVILDGRSHLFHYELGGIAFHSACQACPIFPSETTAMLTAELIEKRIYATNDLHTANTSIIALENTLNGMVFALEEIEKIKALATKFNLKMHLDGARLWNASTATGIPMHEYCKHFDSVSLCLSKGLGAPIGSVLVGTKAFIQRAKQYRKAFGGGWRQAGLLAAAGIFAIDQNWPKLKTDHENAHILHRGLVRLGFDVSPPETNMVWPSAKSLGLQFDQIIAEVDSIQNAEGAAGDARVLLEGAGDSMRIVVHIQTPREAIDRLLKLLEKATSSLLQKSSQPLVIGDAPAQTASDVASTAD
eukprot:TRINITY_DN3571_c0_g1_i2.p1 TRINITY_DN3571_c0_g1~~TRINITY_DN3571_c0_g1_i2.p1  ORF type:complete len:413 (-),score=39.35 TRINITY_DN3571_c0_g1_i2:198-1436(-)